MAHINQTSPRVPSQTEIDRGVRRGRSLRPKAIREAFAALFNRERTVAPFRSTRSAT